MELVISRKVKSIGKIVKFYQACFGFELEFSDKDSATISQSKYFPDIKLTFVQDKSALSPTDEHLFVVYTSEQEKSKLLASMYKISASTVRSTNPYWNENAMLFQDPEGLTIAISDSSFKGHQFRLAFPAKDLAEVERFYNDFDFLKLGGFNGHSGFDGVMMALPGLFWHFEFTAGPIEEHADEGFNFELKLPIVNKESNLFLDPTGNSIKFYLHPTLENDEGVAATSNRFRLG